MIVHALYCTSVCRMPRVIVHALYCTSVCRMPRVSTCLSAHARACPSACVRRPVSVGSHKGLEARAFRALPLLCAKRLRLLQLIYIPNNVMATQREGFEPPEAAPPLNITRPKRNFAGQY